MTNIKKVAKSLIKTVEEKLKILSKIKGERIEVANINKEDVKEFARLKAEMATIQQQMISKATELEVSRQKIIAQLPGQDVDVVDVIIEGVRIHKYPRNTMSGKLNEAKVLELAKKKRILSKITKFERVVIKPALLEALAEEAITYDEYLACTTQNIVPVIEIEQAAPVQSVQPQLQAASS